jgi:hypothetical protein
MGTQPFKCAVLYVDLDNPNVTDGLTHPIILSFVVCSIRLAPVL